MDSEIGDFCHFCKGVPKKYTCPRCNADYCSLICFQSPVHLQCSESFYQTCVVEDLALDTDEDGKEKMMEVLRRFHAEDDDLDSDDDAECLSLTERLADVDLDDTKQVWSRLSSDERQEFEAFLRSGEVTKFVPKWQPWWTVKPPKIKELDHEDEYPKILDGIKEFGALTSKPPSECVPYNIANVISAYVFTARYFNGDYFDFVHEAVGCVAYLSSCLDGNENFGSVHEAVQSVEARCLRNEWITADEENVAAMKEDVSVILEDGYSLHALSDLHRLLSASLDDCSGRGDQFMQHCPVYKVTKKDVKLCLKKIEYFLSYTLYVDPNKVVVS